MAEDKFCLRESKAAYRTALEGLAPEELLLGKVDEDGDIVWSGCPRWLSGHPRTWPTVDGIIGDVLAGGQSAADSGERDQ